MRTITPVKSLRYASKSGGDAAVLLLHGSDWSLFEDLEPEIRTGYEALRTRPGGRPLPTHIDDRELLRVMGLTPSSVLSREQLLTREGILILCQIPVSRREDVLASRLLLVYHYGFACAGLLTWNAGQGPCEVRLRQSDQSVLVSATHSMCALLSSRKLTRRTRRQVTSGAGSTMLEVEEATPVATEFGTIELKAVGGDLVARGEVVQLSSSWKAYRYLLFDGPKRGLFIVGAGLVVVSAGLRFGLEPPPASVADWLDGLVGRLATAAFGAQLVNSAIDFNALAPTSTRRGFRFEAGSTIKWTWVDGRKQE